MKRWQSDFLDGVKSGKPLAVCAQLYAGLPLAKVYDAREEDPEFEAAWDAMLEGQDVGGSLTGLRVLSPAALEAILWAQVADEQAAAYFGMDKDAWLARVQGDAELKRVYDTAREGGKAALQKAQFETALSGDKTMLGWLGKQYLGQTEKMDPNAVLVDRSAPVTVTQIFLRTLTSEQLEQLAGHGIVDTALPVIDMVTTEESS